MTLDSQLSTLNRVDGPKLPFFWGVASSGYQSEGGFNGPGQPCNNWAASEQSGRVQVTDLASDFWSRYDEDFARCREMGLNAFRLGIEWARVQPSTDCSTGAPPPFDDAAIDGYADRIAACRRHGLEPVVTLHHFTHPAWLGADAWLDDATVGRFADYVERAVRQINRRLVEVHHTDPIRLYITINEPNILIQNTCLVPHFPGSRHGWTPAVDSLNHMLAAHVRAYNRIHDCYRDEGWPAPLVSLNTFCSELYWADQIIWDLLVLRERGQADTRLLPLFKTRERSLAAALRAAKLPFRFQFFSLFGRFIHWLVNLLAPKHFHTRAFGLFLRELHDSPRESVFDFIGLDYYDPFAGHMFRPPSFGDLEFPTRSLHAWLMDGLTSKWWDWRILPEGLHFFAGRYAAEFRRPVLIAENGMALRRKPDNSAHGNRGDEVRRSEFLEMHVREVMRLRRDGVPLLGYMHWSLTDNYEWGSFTPRFGLFSIDYAKGTDRLVEDHLGDRPSETYARLVREAEREAEAAAI